jgi:hypothetical protein
MGELIIRQPTVNRQLEKRRAMIVYSDSDSDHE